MSDDTFLLTKEQYAEEVGVSSKTVDDWRKAGKLQEGRDYCFTPSGRPRFYSLRQRAEWEARERDRQRRQEEAEERARQEEQERIERQRIGKEQYLQRTYGMSLAQYEALHEAQSYGCAICGGLPEPSAYHDGLAVDHDHQTGAVRGLLCQRCNTGLGQFYDDPQLVKSAHEYLLNPPFAAQEDE